MNVRELDFFIARTLGRKEKAELKLKDKREKKCNRYEYSAKEKVHKFDVAAGLLLRFRFHRKNSRARKQPLVTSSPRIPLKLNAS